MANWKKIPAKVPKTYVLSEKPNAEPQFKKTLLYLFCPRFLTPPPTSTDVERLFSRAGMALPSHRAGTLPERVDIRENILSLNFALNWD